MSPALNNTIKKKVAYYIKKYQTNDPFTFAVRVPALFLIHMCKQDSVHLIYIVGVSDSVVHYQRQIIY